ncbi:MAG: LCP family protein [Oscillospiraceae bacterium]|nr:LCP family protein [Oscillospiraceae bacterium]
MKIFGNSKRARHKKKEKRLKRWQRAAIAGAVLLILGTATYTVARGFIRPPAPPSGEDIFSGGAAHLPGEYDPEDAKLNNDKYAPEGVTDDDRNDKKLTFLVIGVDDGSNTDTIMVVSYDSVTHAAHVIGIPRDSLVNVKRGNKKINAAYPSGSLRGGGVEGGVSQLQREVKTIIGFVPDFYLVVSMNAVVELVDLVGGVVVDVPFRMRYDDPDQDLHVDIKKGDNQKLNGDNALKFARYRMGNDKRYTISDYDRIKNQQTVINAFVREAIKPANLLKIPQMISAALSNVHTNLSPGELVWIGAELEKANDTDNISFHTMPTKGSSGMPYWYEFLDAAAVLELVNRTINPYDVEITADDVDIIDSVP